MSALPLDLSQDFIMHKKQYSFAFLGFGAVGAALLLNGCGGSTFSKNTYGTYQNAVPAAYGIEATAANGNISGPLGGPFFYETSGLGSVDGKTAYLASALDFTILEKPQQCDPSQRHGPECHRQGAARLLRDDRSQWIGSHCRYGRPIH